MPLPLSPEKKLEWKERIRLQNESGQSLSKWCREQQINYDSMLYWRRQFGLVPAKIIERSSFKELPDSLDKTGITIEYQQIRIHLTKNFDPSILIKCLRMLKAEKC
jgi:hypothetical protein